MDGGVSSVAVEILVQKLISALKEEFSVVRSVDKDAQQLQTTLVKIQGYLNNAQKKYFIAQDAIWLRELEAVAFNADNVLDELTYHLHHKVNKMKTPVDKDKILSSCNHVERPRKMAPKIRKINDDFDSMNLKAMELGLESIVVNAPAAAQNASFETNSFTLDPIFIGRDDHVSKLVENLTQIPQEQMFSILAIVGMDGMGKTTLTRKVFNHENFKTRFGSHIWVHVSQIFDPIILLKKILSLFTPETTSDGVETKESILKKLEQALKGQTYLLVLDGVWNDVRNNDFPEWEVFINSISEVTSTKGNVIIITTRNVEVASLVKPHHTHPLIGLSDEECCSIIKAKIFGNGNVPSGFEIIGRMISKRCQGLPLAANIIGGMLWERDWLSIVQKWYPDFERYDMLDLLRLTFHNLPSPSLKKCFAYISIFPKGRKIVKHELIELWMAEGFLQSDKRNDVEAVGNNLFNVLLRMSLLQVADRDAYGDVESCVMHDLVHDLASAVLGSSLLQVADRDAYGDVESCVMHDLVHDLASAVFGSSNDTNQVRYLLHGEDDSSPITAKYLRTLIFQGEIIDTTTLFSDFKYLHVLTLDCDQVKELPGSVSKLIHLRNLNISRTQIEYLPDWISELWHLQTLNAFTESLRELPSTFKYLINLRHLYIKSGVKLPPEIGRLTDLQELKFRVGEQKGYRIEELGSLDNLKQLYIGNLEKVPDSIEAKQAKLSEKENLIALQLEWDEDGEGERNDESVLEALKPHPDLERLEIIGFKGERFPLWTQKMAVGDPKWSLIGLDKLIEITLGSCQGFVEIPMLGHLPNLKSLSLRRLSNVRLINPSFYGKIDGEGVIFPALESFSLTDMNELSKWEEAKFANEVNIFPRLQFLEINRCKKLECLPSWLFNMAHNLSELDIRHCPKLRELPDGLHALNSLEQITIRGCQKLKRVANPSGGGSLSSLRILEIRDCQELMAMIEPSVPLLEKVAIVELKHLENLPRFLDCLAKSPLLAQLTIVSVPKFIFTSGVGSWSFHRLRKLEIDVSREWSVGTSVSIQKTVDGILQNCRSSLGELNLTGLEIWDHVPESIQHLTGLYSLELENFGVEGLPEWLGGLSSLTRLCISDCTKLKGLPSIDRLTNLKELHIRDCQELQIEFERHKIFHHTSIYVNGHRF